MRNAVWSVGLAGCACLGACAAFGTNTAPPAAPVTLAVARDGDSAFFDPLIDRMRNELTELLGAASAVEIRREAAWTGDWTAPGAAAAMDRALEAPGVDIVLSAGLLVTREALRPDRALPRPVVSLLVADGDLLGAPAAPADRSGKPNLSLTLTPLRLRRDLEVLRDLVPFRTLGLIADGRLLDETAPGAEALTPLGRELGVEIRRLPAATDADAVLSRLDEAIQAVYLAPAFRMPPAQWQRLIDGLNERRIPTFSGLGHADVERGALAALAPRVPDRVARRLALNVQAILAGAAPETLPVLLQEDESLLINALTAVRIGYHPPLDVLISADFLHADQLDAGAPLTLEESVRQALARHVDLAVKQAEVEVVRAEQALAFTPLLPQIEANGQYARIDRDRAEQSFGLQPEERTTAGFTASQALFSDALWSRWRAAARLSAGARADRESVRLDVLAEAARRYLAWLQALALLRIEAGHLDLTRNHLLLARRRQAVGAAGPEEIYRWESEEALRRAALLSALAETDKARVALNQSMGCSQDARWNPRDVEVREDEFHFLGPRFTAQLSDERRIARFEQFSVGQALRRSPDLASLDARIEALAIERAQARRRFVLPEFSAGLAYDRILDQNRPGQAAPFEVEPIDERDEWTAFARATLPLFSGGARLVEVRRLAALERQARESRERVRQLTEQRVRQAFYSLSSSFPNIRLQRRAADRAQANLEVVRRKYAAGAVPILDLLDAQNEAYAARQGAVVADYQYLGDLVEFQRAIAWFEIEQSPEAAGRWLDELEAFMAAPDDA